MWLVEGERGRGQGRGWRGEGTGEGLEGSEKVEIDVMEDDWIS